MFRRGLSCALVVSTTSIFIILLWLYTPVYLQTLPVPAISHHHHQPSSPGKSHRIGGGGDNDYGKINTNTSPPPPFHLFILPTPDLVPDTNPGGLATATSAPNSSQPSSLSVLRPTASAMPSVTIPHFPPPRPTARLRQGTYVGVALPASSPLLPNPVEAFLGVPYATAARFKAPSPLPLAVPDKNRKGRQPVEADKSGPFAPGMASSGHRDEDECLNADIYRPAGTSADARLPVLVTIHSGGFVSGNASEFALSSFVAFAPETPLVAVSFNYRLGPLGFLPSSATAEEGMLNLGLRDQQMLLGWVADNIRAFGGDETRVTLLGFSAGAHSVGHHINSFNSSHRPFQRAILESGAATARAVLSPSHPRHEIQFREFLAAAGAAHVPESELLRALRELPLHTITSAARAVWGRYVRNLCWPFQPVVDAGGLTIPDLPINLLHGTLDGGGNGVEDGAGAADPLLRLIPVINGFNTNEGSGFVPVGVDTTRGFRNFFSELVPGLTEADLDALGELYPDPETDPTREFAAPPPSRGFGKQWRRLDAAYSHYAYVCPVLQTAHHAARVGNRRVYVWEYAARSGRYEAANHGDHRPVAMHDLDALEHKPGLVAAAGEMHRLYARFVTSKDGNPNGKGSGGRVAWPVYVSPFGDDAEGDAAAAAEKEGAGQIMVFGAGNTELVEGVGGGQKGVPVQVRTLTERERERCRFWWDRVELSQGMGVRPGMAGTGGGV